MNLIESLASKFNKINPDAVNNLTEDDIPFLSNLNKEGIDGEDYDNEGSNLRKVHSKSTYKSR